MGTFNPPASFTAPPDQVDPVLRQVKKIMAFKGRHVKSARAGHGIRRVP
jgi:hypothetical protein